jgi:hypothetical protein
MVSNRIQAITLMSENIKKIGFTPLGIVSFMKADKI